MSTLNAPQGPPQHQKPKRRWWVYAIVGGLALFAIIGVANAGKTPVPSYAPPAAAPSVKPAPYTYVPDPNRATNPDRTTEPAVSGPKKTVGDGTYKVGEDIVAGAWKTAGPSGSGVLDMCYYARRKDDTGNLSAITANDNFKGPSRLTVKAGEYVEFSGGCTWTTG